MSLHKLTAGDGYTYLTRQVAAHDATSRGFTSLGDYYEQKGESPGEWLGRGLSGLPGFSPAGGVSEPQMRALWGEGRHPDADRIEAAMRAAGLTEREITAATRLGSRFPVHEGSTRFRVKVAAAFASRNEDVGLPRDWPVPAAERARIRTRVADAMFVEGYGRGPADDRERAGFLARASRQATTAVAGYDLTFSPVKSVSVLWAVAPREVAEQVEAAHRAAVADAVAWLEENATYTRVGAQGVAQVDVTGLLAAAFTHRDSRAGDPDLHTHVAISNKVQTLDEGGAGRWLALDGRPLHASAVAASERYNTRLEAELVARLGVRFAERPGTEPGRRPVRELVGAAPALLTAWSRRRRAIDARRTELAAVFQSEHGRPPSPVEALHLAQQATLETRGRKHEPRSHSEQRATWQTEAAAVLGDMDAVTDMVRAVLAAGRESVGQAWADRTPVDRERWTARTAAEVVATVQTARATWRQTHVRAEAERLARRDGVVLADLDAMVDAVVAQALSSAHSVPLHLPERDAEGVPVAEPAALRRRDGSSVFEVAGTRRFTSVAIVAAERLLVAAAGRRDGRVAARGAVEVALLESEANGFRLNPGQVHLVRQMAGSGARLQLGLAPAGTGKTTAMRALSRAWTDSGGHVLGLAPSAAAAAVLREELDAHTDTLAKLLHALDAHDSVSQRLAASSLPGWVTAIGPDSLVVIDEAGMAGTCDLAAVVEFVLSRGGSVRLIGDDQQLAAIGAGGVLRDIAATHGAVTLSHVVRFTDPAEGSASLALREGDPAAIAYYTDQGRIHVGDLGTCVDQAYAAWSADRGAGRDALMLASTRDLVTELNVRARADRLDHGSPGDAPGGVARTGPDLVGREVELVDGCRVSVGDPVITRRNDRQLRITSTDWVKNGDRWTVTDVTAGGGLRVRHLATGRHVVLPVAYVAEHVVLGYASTVHAAQGVTADVTHVVASGSESRQTMYVAMTRGRTANHLYLTVAGDGDPHTVITRDALLPPTAVDVLTRILARDGTQTSTTSHTRALADPATRLQAAADRYAHALATAAQDMLGPQRLAALETVAEGVLPGLTEHEAWPTLRAHLALHALDGRDPNDLLTTVVTARELGTAHDPAAVLDWRLDPTHLRTAAPGPLPWLPGIPAALTETSTEALADTSAEIVGSAGAGWARYLAARSDLVRNLAADVAATAGSWTPVTAPPWAAHAVDSPLDRQLVVDLAVWRAATGVPDTDPRPTGPAQIPVARARHQMRLAERAGAVIADPRAHAARWRHLAERIDPRLLTDPGWPDLAGRLTVAAHAGVDIAALVTSVAAHHPLPDEQPAAALWWRLTRHLTPVLTGCGGEAGLSPDWAPAVVGMLGSVTAARVQSDRTWPVLVAAVTTATDHGWQPDAVLATAWDLLRAATDPVAGSAAGRGLRDDEIAEALTWRVGLLAAAHPDHDPGTTLLDVCSDDDAPPDPDDAPPPPDPLEPTPVVDDLRDDVLTDEAVDHRDDVDLQTRAELEAVARRFFDGETDAEAQPTRAAGAPDGEVAADVAADVAERIYELNRLAHEFFSTAYPTSWAAQHLQDRLGTDLADDRRFGPGYAPAGWNALVTVLRRAGVSDDAIVTAGLGTIASTGQLIDRFRDRLVLPIRDEHGIVGFVARRDPSHDDRSDDRRDGRHGPKYLNTAETPLYRKADHLYGMADAADLFAAGAVPVLVEGPLDAIAVTLAGGGRHVGVASLGTALTDAQADRLIPHLRDSGSGIVVGTDPDAAGRRAAARAYWLLAARGGAPGHLQLPDGFDPAALYTQDPGRLQQLLTQPGDLAAVLVDDVLTAWARRLDSIAGRVGAARDAIAVLAALPPTTVLEPARLLAQTLDLLPSTVYADLADAVHAWTNDPHGQARQHLEQTLPSAPRPVARPGNRPTRRPLPTSDAGSTAPQAAPPPRLAGRAHLPVRR